MCETVPIIELKIQDLIPTLGLNISLFIVAIVTQKQFVLPSLKASWSC